MGKIRTGMYVRCPIDDEDLINPRQFALGLVVGVDQNKNQVNVAFYDFVGMRKYFDNIPSKQTYSFEDVIRCKILDGSDVVVSKVMSGTVICAVSPEDKDDYFRYYVRFAVDGRNEVELVSENEIATQFTRADVNPLQQLINYEFHNPVWYSHRQVVSNSQHTLRNATFGFETLVGSRVFLLPHQVDTIVRAITETPCRFMLADEVGLGKTIEACVIMNGLKTRIKDLKTLIIAPDSLIYQWQNELAIKFWLDIPVWNQDFSSDLCNTDLIFPLEKIDSAYGKRVLQANWDLCIIDETHRLLGMEEEYKAIFDLSKKAEHILLLSATPIQERKTEYLRLLSLLMPERFGNMEEGEFNNLLEKQAFLRMRIHKLVRDLDHFHEEDLGEDYIYDLKEISDKLNDLTFTDIINDIELDSSDKGLSKIRLSMAYVAEHYQIERRIIRHRRLELLDSMPGRTFELKEYQMAGSESGFYEFDVYEELVDYLETILSSNNNLVLNGEFVRIFLSAVFSSPWALETILNQRKEIIGEKNFEIYEPINLLLNNTPRKEKIRRRDVISSISPIKDEESLIDDLLKVTWLWKKAVKNEFVHLEELYDDPDMIKGRLVKAIDYLSQATDDTKFVIFTAWAETLTILEDVLANRFGRDSVVSFYTKKEEMELQEAVDKFQGDPRCRLMLCDELGGEGRNFQNADEIIHIDLPWSPVQLEQRIGRLDRIGRTKEVKSVVFCAQSTIEKELFNLWDQGLNIFSESLSGLEIALGEINGQILQALSTNIKYGLSNVLANLSEHSQAMRNLVEEERYFDMARQLDSRVTDQINKLITKFDAKDGQSLYNTMMSWTSLVGLNATRIDSREQIVLFRPEGVSPKSMRNTLYTPPNMKDALKRVKRIREVRGTFSRTVAVRREDIIFFAPGDAFFDSIMKNAQESARGRCCAYAKPAEVNWKGFVFTWSPVINPIPLMHLGEDTENIVLAQGYVPLDQITTYEGLSDEDCEVDEVLLIEELSKWFNKKSSAHMGKREKAIDFLRIKECFGRSNLEWFKEHYNYEYWRTKVAHVAKVSKQKANSTLVERIDYACAERDFQRRMDGMRAAKMYFRDNYDENATEYQRTVKIYKALLKGLRTAKLKLDSVAFIWLVKVNE